MNTSRETSWTDPTPTGIISAVCLHFVSCLFTFCQLFVYILPVFLHFSSCYLFVYILAVAACLFTFYLFIYLLSAVCLPFSRCERCDKKVDTIKRLCVKKLPPILVIQLKRFDYDYERFCLIKYNDYFEFPRELDMEPYTVGGLAKIEGEAVDCDPSDLDGRQVRKYRLRGVVVHSGQASGGHYYSFIR